MKIAAERFYTFIFATVILLQLYVNSFKINLAVQVLAILIFYTVGPAKIPVKLLYILRPLLVITALGFIGVIMQDRQIVNIIKDILHIIKPILGLTIGYLFYRRINNLKLFVQTIVISGFISACIHFVILLIFSDIASLEGVREFGKDNFLELIALFMLIYYRKYHEEYLFDSRRLRRTFLVIILLSVIFYFSRTMIVAAIIIFASLSGYTRLTRGSVKYIVVVFGLVAGLYVYLYSVNISRDSSGVEAFLYKVKLAPAEIFTTSIDRENHADLWDHWRGYEAKRAIALMDKQPSSYLIGTGYGSLVNLKFYAPLSAEDSKGMRYISELHNGYVYVFYKVGVIGLLVYLFIIFNWYLILYKRRTFSAVFISAIGLTFIFTTLTITGIYNVRDIMVFIVGALLYFNSRREVAVQ